MRPIEEFVYVGNQVIVPDQASLMRCYYPIIGSEGYALYQYFVAFMTMVITAISLQLF